MYVCVVGIFINIDLCALPKLRNSHTYTDKNQTGSQTSDIRHIHTQTKIRPHEDDTDLASLDQSIYYEEFFYSS